MIFRVRAASSAASPSLGYSSAYPSSASARPVTCLTLPNSSILKLNNPHHESSRSFHMPSSNRPVSVLFSNRARNSVSSVRPRAARSGGSKETTIIDAEFVDEKPTADDTAPDSSTNASSTYSNSEKVSLTNVLTPEETVKELDKYIIGQTDAKVSVATALRNRWRRQQLSAKLQQEVSPMNILMIGPTGSGKTEIARRLARLAEAPFVKVEATRYTEIGYVGKDTDSIIKDLVDVAIKMETEKRKKQVEEEATQKTLDKIVNAYATKNSRPKDEIRNMILQGRLDETLIDIDLPPAPKPQGPLSMVIGRDGGAGGAGGVDLEGLENVLSSFGIFPGSAKSRGNEKSRVTIKVAFDRWVNHFQDQMIDQNAIRASALKLTEENGIVVIDELDKLALQSSGSSHNYNKGEGVQKELLSLLEGTSVSTRHGSIRTDHILFICCGAFHRSKPSDLMPELQGRLPVRVTLSPLTEEDFRKILTEKECNLIEQHTALLQTEGIEVDFTQDGIHEIARFAAQLNAHVENIGARRLSTIIARVVGDISYIAPSKAKEAQGISQVHREKIDAEYVKSRVKSLLEHVDLSRFVL